MADNANTGLAFMSINGQTYRVAGELTYDPGRVNREFQIGQDGVHGQKITPKVPFISATLRDSGGLRVEDFNNMENVTVFLQLINGKTVTGRNMAQVGETAVNTEEGTMTIRWEGPQNSVTEETT
jgi:hypothetical protein